MKDKSIELGMEYLKDRQGFVCDDVGCQICCNTGCLSIKKALQIAVKSAREETAREIYTWLLGDYDKSNNLVRINLKDYKNKFIKSKQGEKR